MSNESSPTASQGSRFPKHKAGTGINDFKRSIPLPAGTAIYDDALPTIMAWVAAWHELPEIVEMLNQSYNPRKPITTNALRAWLSRQGVTCRAIRKNAVAIKRQLTHTTSDAKESAMPLPSLAIHPSPHIDSSATTNSPTKQRAAFEQLKKSVAGIDARKRRGE